MAMGAVCRSRDLNRETESTCAFSCRVLRMNVKKVTFVALTILGLAGAITYLSLKHPLMTNTIEYLGLGESVSVVSAGILAICAIDNVARRRGFDAFFTDHKQDRSLVQGFSEVVVVRTYNGEQNVLKLYKRSTLACQCGEHLASRAEPALQSSVVPTHFLVEENGQVQIKEAREITDDDKLRGSLAPFQKNAEHLSREEAIDLKIASNIAKALQEIHDAGYAHRDIKDENILKDQNGTISLIDFDFLCRKEMQRSCQGTDAYMAPEVFHVANQRKDYDPQKADIFSLGRLLGERLLGLSLVAGRHTVTKWTDATFVKFEGRDKADLATLVKEMTDPFPENRPDIASVVERLSTMQATDTQ